MLPLLTVDPVVAVEAATGLALAVLAEAEVPALLRRRHQPAMPLELQQVLPLAAAAGATEEAVEISNLTARVTAEQEWGQRRMRRLAMTPDRSTSKARHSAVLAAMEPTAAEMAPLCRVLRVMPQGQ